MARHEDYLDKNQQPYSKKCYGQTSRDFVHLKVKDKAVLNKCAVDVIVNHADAYIVFVLKQTICAVAASELITNRWLNKVDIDLGIFWNSDLQKVLIFLWRKHRRMDENRDLKFNYLVLDRVFFGTFNLIWLYINNQYN